MLKERIEEDFIAAMKAHDVHVVSVLRTLRAAIQNAAIAARTSAKTALDDAAVEEVVRQEVKRMKDALVDFTRAARHDLVEAAEREVSVLGRYLSKGIDPSELALVAKGVVTKLRTQGITEFGAIMREVMAEVRGRAEGGDVAAAVRAAMADDHTTPQS